MILQRLRHVNSVYVYPYKLAFELDFLLEQHISLNSGFHLEGHPEFEVICCSGKKFSSKASLHILKVRPLVFDGVFLVFRSGNLSF